MTSEYETGTAVPDLTQDDLDIEAPVADALEQRTPTLASDPVATEQPPALPDDVNPADALEQSRPVTDQDDDDV